MAALPQQWNCRRRRRGTLRASSALLAACALVEPSSHATAGEHVMAAEVSDKTFGSLYLFGNSDQAGETAKGANWVAAGSIQGAAVDFVPPRLDFGERPLCSMTRLSVRVINNLEEEAQVLSVFTTNSVFQSTVEDPVASPGGGAAVSVGFLPREEGPQHGVLFVTTTNGDFMYNLAGVGIRSHYRATPVLGQRMALGSAFHLAVSLYNPHDTPARVISANTSVPFFTLSLASTPSGAREEWNASQVVERWELAPHQQKAVISLSFVPTAPGDYSGYVSVQIAGPEGRDMVHIPLTLTALPAGVHPVRDAVRFGTLTEIGQVKHRDIEVLNSGPDSRIVLEIVPQEKLAGLEVQTLASVLPPGEVTLLARVSLTATRADGEVGGKFLIRVGGVAAAFLLPYSARIKLGKLEYQQNTTIFLSAPGQLPQALPRPLVLKNLFSDAVHIREVSSLSPFFAISGFRPVVIPPERASAVLTVALSGSDYGLFAGGTLVLWTNVSKVYIPLQACHGKLAFRVLNSGEQDVTLSDAGAIADMALLAHQQPTLEFGLLGVPEHRVLHFALVNPNPLPVVIKKVHARITAKQAAVKLKLTGRKIDKKLTLRPGQVSYYNATLDVSAEDDGAGKVIVETSYQSLEIGVSYVSMRGAVHFLRPGDTGDVALEPDEAFDVRGAFVGSVTEEPLVLRSTYRQPIRVVSASSSDPRFEVRLHEEEPTIEPNTRTDIGTVVVHLQADTSGTHRLSPKRSKRPRSNRVLTQDDLDQLRQVLETNRALHGSNGTAAAVITLETHVRRPLRLRVVAHSGDAQLTNVSTVDFGTLAVGYESMRMITVHNPSQSDIDVALFGWHEVPAALQSPLQALLQPRDFQDCSKDFVVTGTRRKTVPPGESVELGPIIYNASSPSRVSCAVFVRNPITVIDVVDVVGHGGLGDLRFRERTHTADKQELRIVINATHLAKWDPHQGSAPGSSRGAFISWRDLFGSLGSLDWLNSSYLVPEHFRGSSPAPVSKFHSDPVKFLKTFFPVNRGNYPVNATAVALGREPRTLLDQWACSVSGLKVDKCGAQGGLYLRPNESSSMTLSYAPDFSVDAIHTTLWIQTEEQGMLAFPVVVTLPRDQVMLSYDSIPHTVRETFLRGVVIIALTALGVHLCCSVLSEFLIDPQEGGTSTPAPAQQPPAAVAKIPAAVPGDSEAPRAISPAPSQSSTADSLAAPAAAPQLAQQAAAQGAPQPDAAPSPAAAASTPPTGAAAAPARAEPRSVVIRGDGSRRLTHENLAAAAGAAEHRAPSAAARAGDAPAAAPAAASDATSDPPPKSQTQLEKERKKQKERERLERLRQQEEANRRRLQEKLRAEQEARDLAVEKQREVLRAQKEREDREERERVQEEERKRKAAREAEEEQRRRQLEQERRRQQQEEERRQQQQREEERRREAERRKEEREKKKQEERQRQERERRERQQRQQREREAARQQAEDQQLPQVEHAKKDQRGGRGKRKDQQAGSQQPPLLVADPDEGTARRRGRRSDHSDHGSQRGDGSSGWEQPPRDSVWSAGSRQAPSQQRSSDSFTLFSDPGSLGLLAGLRGASRGSEAAPAAGAREEPPAPAQQNPFQAWAGTAVARFEAEPPRASQPPAAWAVPGLPRTDHTPRPTQSAAPAAWPADDPFATRPIGGGPPSSAPRPPAPPPPPASGGAGLWAGGGPAWGDRGAGDAALRGGGGGGDTRGADAAAGGAQEGFFSVFALPTAPAAPGAGRGRDAHSPDGGVFSSSVYQGLFRRQEPLLPAPAGGAMHLGGDGAADVDDAEMSLDFVNDILREGAT